MAGANQKRILLEMFENLPGLTFMILLRTTADLRLAGWVGTVLAAMVCVAYARKYLRPQPILLGINIFMVVVTPLIECLVYAGHGSVASVLIGNIPTLVLISVFTTGLVLTVFTKNGFLNYPTDSQRAKCKHSAVLLGICVLGAVWSQLAGDNYLVSLGAPLMVLFGVHQLLRAGATDQQTRNGAILACASPQSSAPDASV